MVRLLTCLLITGCLATGVTIESAQAQPGKAGQSGVTFGGGIPGGQNPSPAQPLPPKRPVDVGPGTTGQSGVTFGGGVPGGQDPGPAQPSAPTKKKQ
jgi:hypothetical protein